MRNIHHYIRPQLVKILFLEKSHFHPEPESDGLTGLNMINRIQQSQGKVSTHRNSLKHKFVINHNVYPQFQPNFKLCQPKNQTQKPVQSRQPGDPFSLFVTRASGPSGTCHHWQSIEKIGINEDDILKSDKSLGLSSAKLRQLSWFIRSNVVFCLFRNKDNFHQALQNYFKALSGHFQFHSLLILHILAS